jgi:LEA14-like dessication related protein
MGNGAVKKKANYKTLLPFLILLALVACASGMSLQQPDIRLSNITPLKMTLFEQSYDIGMKIQNPNNVDLSVSGMNYKIVLNEHDFAKGVSDEDFVVPALGETTVHVSIGSNPISWMRMLKQLNSNEINEFSYSLSGTLFLENHTKNNLSFVQSGSFSPRN